MEHGDFWFFFYLFVVLKIPILGAMALIWWAVKAEPATDEAPPSGEHDFKRLQPDPKAPRDPRRGGPHGGAVKPASDCGEPRRRPGTPNRVPAPHS